MLTWWMPDCNRTYGLGGSRLKHFKLAAIATILDIGMKRFLQF